MKPFLTCSEFNGGQKASCSTLPPQLQLPQAAEAYHQHKPWQKEVTRSNTFYLEHDPKRFNNSLYLHDQNINGCVAQGWTLLHYTQKRLILIVTMQSTKKVSITGPLYL